MRSISWPARTRGAQRLRKGPVPPAHPASHEAKTEGTETIWFQFISCLSCSYLGTSVSSVQEDFPTDQTLYIKQPKQVSSRGSDAISCQKKKVHIKTFYELSSQVKQEL